MPQATISDTPAVARMNSVGRSGQRGIRSLAS
jgi:hypothetical protein